jgi:hypothetical protein
VELVCDICGTKENVIRVRYSLLGKEYKSTLCRQHAVEQQTDSRTYSLYSEVKDSGIREEFDTGSKRDTAEGKGRYDLLAFYALQRLAQHYENGAVKYGDHNWRKGQPLSRYLSSTLRHITKWAMGFRDEDHLAAALWNIASIIETEEMIAQGKLSNTLDDIWKGYSE